MYAPGDGEISVIDVLGRGMRYLSDEPRPCVCPTCHQVGHQRADPFQVKRARLRWLSYDAGCKPVRFYPQMLYLPPELEPLGAKPGARVRAFLERAVRLLGRRDGILFIWWRIEEITDDRCTQLVRNKEVPVPRGSYLLLSPYWSPSGGGLDWKFSEHPGPGYPKAV